MSEADETNRDGSYSPTDCSAFLSGEDDCPVCGEIVCGLDEATSYCPTCGWVEANWQKSDTPETDEAERDALDGYMDRYHYEPMTSVARRLERQRNEVVSALGELYAAMRRYEVDADEEPPVKHRVMMRRAAALLRGASGSRGE